MQVFRVAVLLAWAAIIWITVAAVTAMGWAPGGSTFFADFAHPWRAQYNADFTLHLLLFAAWVIYREKNPVVGVLCGLGVALMGGAFSLPYLLAATFRSGGSVQRLLTGDRAQA